MDQNIVLRKNLLQLAMIPRSRKMKLLLELSAEVWLTEDDFEQRLVYQFWSYGENAEPPEIQKSLVFAIPSVKYKLLGKGEKKIQPRMRTHPSRFIWR
ncbi:hypothetical protein KIN20_015425 [Parelaphostrongylus tenuis]|uniref:Uncharacterized protein n=1 Tax=Parelaphostrongylus tenuis TaxID=148309 RepID=A0AAD5MEV8_PARTN|nr:hypothetical protein KIN20_015425 [Parelaphostrongylus tenuis]